MSASAPNLAQKIAVEAIGTFTLILLGCGILALTGAGAGSIDASAPLAFGFVLVALTFAFGRISGGHFNPAVSVGAAASGRLAWAQAGAYIAAQLVGALVGGLALWAILHGFEGFDSRNTMGQSFYGDDGGGTGLALWSALLVELILTLLFVWLFLAATDARTEERREFAPIAVGLGFGAVYFFSLPLVGGAANPAKAFGVGFFAGGDAIQHLWLPVLVPLVAAVAAGVTYPVLFGRDADVVTGSGLNFSRPARTSAAQAQPGYQGGYAAPGADAGYQQQWGQGDAGAQQGGQVAQAEPAAQASAGSWEPEPIIQDGWQWDYAAQEWKPVEQAAAAQQGWGAGGGDTQGWAPEGQQAQQQGWPPADQGDGRTQIRPPEGQ